MATVGTRTMALARRVTAARNKTAVALSGDIAMRLRGLRGCGKFIHNQMPAVAQPTGTAD